MDSNQFYKENSPTTDPASIPKPINLSPFRAQSSPPSQGQSFSAQKKQKRWAGMLFKILILIIELGVIGGGVALAMRAWDPAWSPFRPNPEKVILKAWDQLKTIKSQNFNSEFLLSSEKISYSPSSSGSFKLDMKSNGGVDYSNPDKRLASVKGSINASAKDNTGNQYDFSITGETRLISKEFFLKLDEINLGNLNIFLMMFGLDTSKIKGQWIRFTAQDAVNNAGQYSGVSSQQQAKAQENLKELLDKVVKVLLNKKTYDISQFPDNRGAEGKEYHYAVSLNQKKVIEASPEIFNLIKDYYAKSFPGQQFPKDNTLEKFQKDINDYFDKVGPTSVDLFIGKKDNFFHKIQFVKSINTSKFDSSYAGTVQINFKIEQSGINKPIEVSAPAEYKNFEDLFPLVKTTIE